MGRFKITLTVVSMYVPMFHLMRERWCRCGKFYKILES